MNPHSASSLGGGARLRAAGFSLVEMLMAAFIMGIGLLGLATLQMMAIRTAGVGTRMTDSVLLAERVLESASMEATQSYLAAKAGTTIANARLYTPGTQLQYFKGDLTQGTATDTDIVYTVQVTVTNLVTAFQGGMDQVDVNVSFVEMVNGAGANRRNVQVSRQVTHG